MSNFCYLDNADDEFNFDLENLKIKSDYNFNYKPQNNMLSKENDNIKKDKNVLKNKKDKNKVKFNDNNNDKKSKITNNKSKNKTIQHHDKNCFDYGLNKSKNNYFINDKDNDLKKINVCDEKKKVKYFDSINRNMDLSSNKSNINCVHRIDDESFLLLPRMNSKQKANVELKDTMHPNDYSIDLKYDTINKTKTYTSYYGDHYGPGKGFGNSIVSNEMRTGFSSRDDTEKFNQTIESKIDGPRDILFKDYQNPNNLILPFPRGGENTRKSVQSNNKNLSTEFNFKY